VAHWACLRVNDESTQGHSIIAYAWYSLWGRGTLYSLSSLSWGTGTNPWAPLTGAPEILITIADLCQLAARSSWYPSGSRLLPVPLVRTVHPLGLGGRVNNLKSVLKGEAGFATQCTKRQHRRRGYKGELLRNKNRGIKQGTLHTLAWGWLQHLSIYFTIGAVSLLGVSPQLPIIRCISHHRRKLD